MSHDEELRWVRRREGAHRSSSRATAGYERDLLREDNTENLLGPTESRPADIGEIVRSHRPAPTRPTPGQEFGYQLVDAIMEALAPHIDRGVDAAVDSARLGISKLWRWATRGPSPLKTTVERLRESESADSKVETVLVAASASIDDMPEALALQPQSITVEEYQAILLSALMADQYAARARQVLANVRVRGDALPTELGSAVRAALEGPTPVIDEESLAQVVELLRASRTPDGEFMLVLSDHADEPRSIPDGKVGRRT